jgi:acetyl esterase/lipase
MGNNYNIGFRSHIQPSRKRNVQAKPLQSKLATAKLLILLLLSKLPSAVTSFISYQSTDRRLLRRTTTTTAFVTTSTNSESTSSASIPSSSKTIGDWEEIHGNFLLRPKPDEGPPRALLHFLGGAIVGQSPHIFYRYILERLASKGYVVVATPYSLSFDYLITCDDIISRFERVAIPLARTYGALPVIGIGHSCGSLLQVLITSLFPDTPRAANALISYNNKPVSEAVPFFDEFFAPFFTYVAAKNETSITRSSGTEIIRVSLDLALYTVKGELPPDDLLTQAGKLLLLPTPFRAIIQNNKIVLPLVLRDSYKILSSPATTAIENAGLVPIVTEVVCTLQQIPSLIDEVADGVRDFVPPPMQVKAAARRSYRARRTLLIQYENDPIDESNVIEELLQVAGQIIQMKRPMIPIDVQLKTISGNHITPLIAPPLDIATQIETVLGSETAKDVLLYTQADQTVDELIRWLEEANL